MAEVVKFNADKAQKLIDWLISLDDPESLDYEHRKTVTLDQIIREAKATYVSELIVDYM